MVFERGMNMRFSEMIGNTGEPIRERLMRSTDAHTFWVQELSRERKAMKEETYEGGRVWSKREKDLFFSQLEANLEKKVLQIGRR